ncbi:MAG TPA: lauroyl-Kdo(2)-lipid IV(A) myristoyltransferase, partial [Gammaproteobacteria bacterium]|nr:lauroyl-Kdo(2)-lipid IV(A) myristoyltransferase [Gammaproteobacteria bacterium]
MTINKTHLKGRQPLPWPLLMPKYWHLWLGIFTLSLMSYLPTKFRDALGRGIGTLIFNKNQKRRTI